MRNCALGQDDDEDGSCAIRRTVIAYHLGVIARLDRAIQYSRDAGAGIEKPRRTGSPACAGDDSCGGDATSHSRDTICSSLTLRSALSLEEGAGKAGCRSHPWAPSNGDKLGGRTTGVTGNNPAFPARWVTAYFVLSPARLGLLVTALARCFRIFARGHLPLGRQDHTTSPSASRALVSHTLGVHRISTHARDDREAPLDRVRWMY